MATSTRERALAWVKTRLETIGGYTVLRNPRDDLTPALPAIAFKDPPEPEPATDRSGEYERTLPLEIAVGLRRAGLDSGEAAGTAINEALAQILNVLLDHAAFASCVDAGGRVIVRDVQPGAIGMLEFLADAEAAETIAVASQNVAVTYTHSDTDAFTASP